MAKRPKSPATEAGEAAPRRRRLARKAKTPAPDRATRRASRSGNRVLDDRPIVTDADDPRSAPSASGGWSETVLTVPQALILPTNGRGMVQEGGVFDAQGGFVDQAVHWRRGQALSSLVSGGCIVSGSKVSSSVLFSGVRVHSFCEINEAVLLPAYAQRLDPGKPTGLLDSGLQRRPPELRVNLGAVRM